MFLTKTQGVHNTIPIPHHILFWVTYYIFNSIRWGSYFGDYWYGFKSNLVEFPLHIAIVYFNIFYLVPQFIIHKKYKNYIFCLILLLILHYFIRFGLDYWLISKNVWPEAQGLHQAFGFNHFITVTLGEIYVLSLVSAIKFIVDFTIERHKNTQLLELQSQTELSFLKAQIQPHFFFNTLNNLYALTLLRSKRAAEVVLKLSEIMRYIIYDATQKKVPLLKEINYIVNYIELEKIRRGDLVESRIDIKGEIDNTQIPPLLFLPFIENCFKHGPNDGSKIFLKIKFEKQGKNLKFKIKNNVDSDDSPATEKGIGIHNLRRRLELLYGKAFELKMRSVENQYKVLLKIPLQ